MQLGSGGSVIPLLTLGSGQSPGWEPGKFDFFSSQGHRLAHYLFVFHVKFSAACLNWYR